MDSIQLFFSTLRWQDLLDICISSYILFRLYALFRGTAAFRVMVGLAFLWLFQGLSLKLGLIVLSYAIQGITAAAAIIIVVIFRNEIRTVFQTKNLRAIFWGGIQKAGGTAIEAASEAVFELSRKSVGALLVYPGKDDLEEHVQNGIQWEGMVSREMVESIFWHGNPVHDGAAIVDGDRISRVACILPLSLRDDLPVYYGTRHRAAVGLSEKSDALAVVVSEETGQVMTAKGGDVAKPKTRGELKAILEEHLGQRSSNAKAEKNERVEMAVAACLSFLLVSIAWFGFTRSSDTLVSFEVPIQYTGRAQGMDIVSASDDAAKVQLIGARTLIRSVRSDKVSVIVDLSSLPVGTSPIKILPSAVSMPPGVSLNQLSPSQIEVTLDRTVTRDLPVQIDWTGRLPENFLMTDAKVEPSSIRVTGRSLVLEELGALYTEKLSLDDIRESGRKTSLIMFPESIRPSASQNETVTVFYWVEERGGASSPGS
jgi:uncharacterized protein (TIGR00159 family)